MDLGPHANFIIAAYVIAALVVVALIAWVFADYDAQRRLLPEFDLTDPAAVEQFVSWEREILAPAGKRWFGARIEGTLAGFGGAMVARSFAGIISV